MRQYIILQFKILNRQMADFGINPAVGYVIVLAAFIGFSLLLFTKIEFAEYIYIVAGLSLLARLSETRRNHFLKTCFPGKGYYKIRIFENTVVVAPFAIFLAYKLLFIHALTLIVLAALLALFTFSGRSGFTIPTPFGKKPFEFTVGFRNAIFVFILAYFLVFMSVWVENYNLGIFSLVLVFLVCITFYFNPENEFYVWIFNLSPGKFLVKKILTALLYSTMISLPVAMALMVFYPGEILVTGGFLLAGYLYLATIVLAKYSSFPHQVNLPQFIILAVSVWFPPLLIAVIPFFFRQSVKRLNEILA